MKNPATTISKDDLNSFTRIVKDLENPIVRLRNGFMIIPEWKEAEDETCSDGFSSKLQSALWWSPDGTSFTSSDYDMIEILGTLDTNGFENEE